MISFDAKTPQLIQPNRSNLFTEAVKRAGDGELDRTDLDALKKQAQAGGFNEREQLFIESLERNGQEFAHRVGELQEACFEPSLFSWSYDAENSQVIPDELKVAAESAHQAVQGADGKPKPESCETMTNTQLREVRKDVYGEGWTMATKQPEAEGLADVKGRVFDAALLTDLANQGRLKPGMILFINTDQRMSLKRSKDLSPEEKAAGVRGLDKSDRHWFTYQGQNEKGEPVFADPYGTKRSAKQMEAFFGGAKRNPDIPLSDFLARSLGDHFKDQPELAADIRQLTDSADFKGKPGRPLKTAQQLERLEERVVALMQAHPEHADRLSAFMTDMRFFDHRKVHSIIDPYAGKRESGFYAQ